MAKKNNRSNAQRRKIEATKARKERRLNGGKPRRNLAAKTNLVVNAKIASVLDRQDILLAARKGKNIGITNDDLAKKTRITVLEARMALLGKETKEFLEKLPSSLFPIVNSEYHEEYPSNADENLFHRFYAYLYETIYFTVAASNHRNGFVKDPEAYVWDYIADQKEELFKGFLGDECVCQAA